MPKQLEGKEAHAHNRLLTSAMLDADERRKVARTICEKLSTATGPVAFLLPEQGGNEWDRPGGALHDAEGLAAFCAEMKAQCPDNVQLHALDMHINDAAFCDKALEIFDGWRAGGTIAD